MPPRPRRTLRLLLPTGLVLAAVLVAACTDGALVAAPSTVALPVPVTSPGANVTTPGASTPTTTAAPRGVGGCVQPVATDVPIRSFPAVPCMVIDTAKPYRMTVETSLGTFVALLDPKVAPVAVNNMAFLAQQHFYDGLVFPRTASWVIQTGDPSKGDPPRTAWVGYRFADELPPAGYRYRPGDVLMANSGPDTNTSQWWVAPNEQAATLPLNYTLMGRVAEGLEVAQAIGAVPVQPGTQAPLDPPRVLHLTVEPIG